MGAAGATQKQVHRTGSMPSSMKNMVSGPPLSILPFPPAAMACWMYSFTPSQYALSIATAAMEFWSSEAFSSSHSFIARLRQPSVRENVSSVTAASPIISETRPDCKCALLSKVICRGRWADIL